MHCRALPSRSQPDMKADKNQFDEVLRRMLQKPPQKTADIKSDKKKAPKPSQK
jgi:hypothetical protein